MGERGPLKTPTQLRQLSSNPATQNHETNEPVPIPSAPEKPSHMRGEAAEEWDRVCKHLSDLQLLATSDAAIISAYCIAWELYWENYVSLKQFGPILVSTKTHYDGTTTKIPYAGPHAGLHSMFFKELMTCCAALGLGPAWRGSVSKVPSSDTKLGKSRLFKVVG